MTVGIIILSRYSSTRLPGKALMLIDGQPLLKRIHDRLSNIESPTQIVVATSQELSDDAIETFCQQEGINVYRGSLDNVAQRFLDCAKFYDFDYAIRINGDNLFADPVIISQMIKTTLAGSYDFVSNVKGRTFPYGMSVEIVKTVFYERTLDLMTTARHQEHVTLYFYENPDLGDRLDIINEECPDGKELPLAIDLQADVEMAEKIIRLAKKSFTTLTMCEIVALYRSVSNE